MGLNQAYKQISDRPVLVLELDDGVAVTCDFFDHTPRNGFEAWRERVGIGGRVSITGDIWSAETKWRVVKRCRVLPDGFR